MNAAITLQMPKPPSLCSCRVLNPGASAWGPRPQHVWAAAGVAKAWPLQLGQKTGIREGLWGHRGGEGALKGTEELNLEVEAGNGGQGRLVSPEFTLGCSIRDGRARGTEQNASGQQPGRRGEATPALASPLCSYLHSLEQAVSPTVRLWKARSPTTLS